MFSENKNLKNEIEVHRQNINSANVALKNSKKETKETSYKLEKEFEQMEIKIKDLKEYKNQKIAEEKELKNKTKKADKKLKSIQEREAKHKLVRMKANKEAAVFSRNVIRFLLIISKLST